MSKITLIEDESENDCKVVSTFSTEQLNGRHFNVGNKNCTLLRPGEWSRSRLGINFYHNRNVRASVLGEKWSVVFIASWIYGIQAIYVPLIVLERLKSSKFVNRLLRTLNNLTRFIDGEHFIGKDVRYYFLFKIFSKNESKICYFH